MKAWTFERFGGKEVLAMKEMPLPQPAADEVQLHLKYAGTNPVDWKIREGYFKDAMEHGFPVIPGWEGAGVVSACGKEVKGLRMGDEVLGYFRKPLIKWGTYAEVSCIGEAACAKKPRSMSWQLAASIPLTGLTAWQALFEHAKLQPGESLLVQGGGGGVGGMAVQFAHQGKAVVLATGSTSKRDYIASLGADCAIDYEQENVADLVRQRFPKGVDVALDCVGGETTEATAALVRPGGRLVSIVDHNVARLARDDLKAIFAFVYPNGAQLQQIVALFEAGKIQPPHIEVLPLAQAVEAQEKLQHGHTRGKMVLQI